MRHISMTQSKPPQSKLKTKISCYCPFKSTIKILKRGSSRKYKFSPGIVMNDDALHVLEFFLFFGSVKGPN